MFASASAMSNDRRVASFIRFLSPSARPALHGAAIVPDRDDQPILATPGEPSWSRVNLSPLMGEE